MGGSIVPQVERYKEPFLESRVRVSEFPLHARDESAARIGMGSLLDVPPKLACSIL